MRGYQRAVLSAPQPVTPVWESPASIDNTGVANVSAALTDWLANTGSPGDIFKLRRGSGFAPGVFWVPQGIRIGKAMTFDLNGCWLLTGTVMGDQDPNIAASAALYPPLWSDWEESGSWPLKRTVVNIQAVDVTVQSSFVNARIQGAARNISFRGGFVDHPAAIPFNASLEGQHGIRVGGGNASTPKVSNVVIDLTNIAVEFVHGDGVLINDLSSNITILGRNLGEAVVGGTISTRDDAVLSGADGGLGGTVSGSVWVPTAQTYPGIHHCGRHAVGMGFTVIGLTVDGIAAWRIARSILDMEPAGAGDFVSDVQFINTETGIHTLNWVSAAAFSCNNITIADNVCYELISIWSRPVEVTTIRHSNWRILRNTGGCFDRQSAVSQDSTFELDRTDGLEIIDNFQPVHGTNIGIDVGSSTNVTISPAEDIQFPDPAAPASGLGLSQLGLTALGS